VGRFCARCGAEEARYIHGLCSRCFWEDPEIKVPPEVRLFYCRVCRSHMQGKRWFRMKSKLLREDMEDAAMTEVARLAELPEGVSISYVRADVLKEDEEGLPKRLSLKVGLEEAACGTTKEVESLAKVSYMECSACDGATRGAYEATVQVRGEGREVDAEDKKAIEAAFREVDRRTAGRGRQEVTEIKEAGGGYDIKFVSLNSARIFSRWLSEFFGAAVSESPKLIGVSKDTGGRAYRNTVSARLPAARAGTLIEYGGRAFRISGFDRGMAIVEGLDDGKSRHLLKREVEGIRIIRDDEVRPVRLDSRSPGCGAFYDARENRFFEALSDAFPKQMREGEAGIMISIGGGERIFADRKGRAKARKEKGKEKEKEIEEEQKRSGEAQ